MASKQQKKPTQKPAKRQDNRSDAKSQKDRIIDAALKLAAIQSWDHCGIRDIAAEAGVTLADFYDIFDDRTDIMVAYSKRVDREVLEQFSEPDYESSPRDRLFEILMERFDRAGDHREALVSIVKSQRSDPKQVVIAMPHVAASMTRMLEAAGLETSGLRGAARVAGLSAGYLWVLRTWLDDESEDLSKTMAALDRTLGNLEKAADMVGL